MNNNKLKFAAYGLVVLAVFLVLARQFSAAFFVLILAGIFTFSEDLQVKRGIKALEDYANNWKKEDR
jgi:hypothetical protein